MNIIIVGCGKVGYTIAKNLATEHRVNLTIIDNRAEAFEKAAETIDAMLVRGNGLNAKTLLEAGADEADLLISVTDADEANVLCCISAKQLGTKNTAARVRNPEYALDVNKYWKDLGLDIIINPEQETAREISQLLRFPTADGIDTFVNGEVEIVSFKLSEEHGVFVGKSVAQVFNNKKANVLLTMIERDNAALIPKGDLVFESHDIISVLGRPSDVTDYFALIGEKTDRIKNVVIIGGGEIAHYLVELMQGDNSGTGIKIIELDKEKCEELSEKFPRCLIINGDGTDEEVLTSEITDPSVAVVCLTDRDEENAVIALYSLQLGVRKVILKINHINPHMVKNLGLGSIVSPKNITSDRMIRYIRGLAGAVGSNIRTMYKLFDSDEHRVEAVEFIAGERSRCLNVALRELKIKRGVLIGCIVRGFDIIIPSGETSIKSGDSVIIIAKNENILELDDILAR